LLLRRRATFNAPCIEADLDEGYDNISNLFSTSSWTLDQGVSTIETSRWIEIRRLMQAAHSINE